MDLLTLAPAALGGAGVYLMRRIAGKIEARLDQVEDHEKRLTVIEAVCSIRHDDEHSPREKPGYSFSP